MHDDTAEGNDFFKCDFCLSGWSEDRPMVEGHQGSLVCSSCLTIAYAEAVVHKQRNAPAGMACTMCLEERPDLAWVSPLREEAAICVRCIKQAAGRLVKDPDTDWAKPTA